MAVAAHNLLYAICDGYIVQEQRPQKLHDTSILHDFDILRARRCLSYSLYEGDLSEAHLAN